MIPILTKHLSDKSSSSFDLIPIRHYIILANGSSWHVLYMWPFGSKSFLRPRFLSCVFLFFFFFFFVQPQQLTLSTVNSTSVHCSRSHKLHFSATFLFKMGPTALFTHLKIISLQCFQFQFSVSAKISSIQTHPISFLIPLVITFSLLSILTNNFYYCTCKN